MKKLTMMMLVLAFAISASAQKGKFGYLNYEQTMKLMPQYAKAGEALDKLQQDFADETQRIDLEFYRQYIEYLQGQNTISPTILLKRQKELQDTYDKNMEFKKTVKDSIMSEREKLLLPIRVKLIEAVHSVAKDLKLDYVIDTGAHTYLYIGEENSVDISEKVFKKLGISYTPSDDAALENIGLSPVRSK